MFDIKAIQKDAEEELYAERAERAKSRIKAKLIEIERAKKIVANLEAEYALLLKDLGSDG
jgi:hypothetical protein